jgi:outer membrane usher protein
LIKINYSLIFLGALIGSQYGFANDAVSNDELFNKVFGTKQTEKVIAIDLSYNSFFVGSINARIAGDRVIAVEGAGLKKVLHPLLREEKVSLYNFPDGFISPEEFGIKFPATLKYNPSEMFLGISIPPEDVKPKESKVFDDFLPDYSRRAIQPAAFSAALNYKLEHVSVTNSNEQDALLGQSDFFSTIGKVSVESHQSYDTNRNNEFYRQSSKVVYDLPNNLQRFEAGDVDYTTLGYQNFVSIGGVSFHSDFTLNPYKTFTPTSSFEYLIESRSLVRTYVNGSLLKTEYMNPGRYSVRDIPLNNGLNKIIVEITSELGVKKVLIFNQSSSLELLNSGTSRYSIATGAPSVETENKKEYLNRNFSSAFYQYGVNRYWTTGLYGEGSDKNQMLGTNQILATSLGNFSTDVLTTKNKFNSGYLSQLTYQLSYYGENWYDSFTITSKYEYRSPYYNALGVNFKNQYDWASYLSFNFPIVDKATISIGGNYQHPTIALDDRYGYNASLNYHFNENGSISANFSRSKDDLNNWNEQLYFFFNYSFGDGSNYVSAYYENETQTKRLTAIHDNGLQINNLKASATVEDNETSKLGTVDLQYNTVLADVGIREDVTNYEGYKTSLKTSVRLMSAFAYVNNGEDSAFSISRPISGSYVIFKPREGWEGQKFGVQANSRVNESETGLFGEALISNLSPYQYRRLQLNPLYLEPGYVLGQESFVVQPRHNSGHLFMIGQSGLMVLKGRMVDGAGKAVAMKLGLWQSSQGKTLPFFTGRDGEFLIEGIDDSSGLLIINDEKLNPFSLNLEAKKVGIQDLGEIIIPKNENAL